MKVQALKTIVPVMVSLFASTAAVINSDNEIKKMTSVQGWSREYPFMCVMGRICNNISGPICMDGTKQMYGKDSPVGDCVMILTHRP